MKKISKSLNYKNVILYAIGISFAVLSIFLTIGFSTAWFKSTTKIEGELDFTRGIVISYDGYNPESSKLLYIGNNGKTAELLKNNVTADQEFELVSPTFTPTEDTVSYLLRFKIQVSYKTETETKYIELSTDNPLFSSVPVINSNWLKGADGWYYNVGTTEGGQPISDWTNGRLNFADLKVNEIGGAGIDIFSKNASERLLKIGVVPENSVSISINFVVDAIQSTENAFNNEWNLYGINVNNSIPVYNNIQFSTNMPYANYNDEVQILGVPPTGYEFSKLEFVTGAGEDEVRTEIEVGTLEAPETFQIELSDASKLDATVYYKEQRNALGYEDICVAIEFVMPMEDIGNFYFTWTQQGNLSLNVNPATANQTLGGYEYDGSEITITAQTTAEGLGINTFEYWWMFNGEPIAEMGTEETRVLTNEYKIRNVEESGAYTVGVIIKTDLNGEISYSKAAYNTIYILIKPTNATVDRSTQGSFCNAKEYSIDSNDVAEEKEADIPVVGINNTNLVEGVDYSIRYCRGLYTSDTTADWISSDASARPTQVEVYSAVITMINKNYKFDLTELSEKKTSVEFSITPISVDTVRTIEFYGITYTYEKVERKLEVLVNEGEKQLPGDITVSYFYVDETDPEQIEHELGDGIVNAGSYKVIARFSFDSNYEQKEDMEAILKINPITNVQLSADSKTSIYNRELEELTYTVQNESIICEGDDLGVNLSCPVEVGSYVGNYTISITTSNPNYAFTLGENIFNNTYTVTKEQPAEVVFPTASAIRYGQKLSVSSLSGQSGDGTFNWVNGSSVPNANQTSVQQVVFTPRDAGNYDYSEFEGYNADTKKITRNVNLVVDTYSVYYNHIDSSLSQVYDKTTKIIDEEISGISDGQGSYVILTKGVDYIVKYSIDEETDENHNEVGVYTVLITMLNTNYVFPENISKATYIDSDNIKVTMEITKAQLIKNSGFSANAITYGQILKDVTFNNYQVTANNIAGVISIASTLYEAPETKPLAGTYTGNVVFTPTDTKNYNSLIVPNVSLVVNKATPVLDQDNFASAETLTYNKIQKLSQSEITAGKVFHKYTADGTAHSDEIFGTFDWKNKDIIPIVKNTGYTVVFTPTDTSNFKTIEFTLQITVNKQIPIIPWPVLNTTNNIYGTKLGDIVLISFTTADSNGSFAWNYTTPSDIYLDVPNYKSNIGYSMTFTAEDTDNYDYSSYEGYNYDNISKMITVTQNIIVKVVPYVVNPTIDTNTAIVKYNAQQRNISFTIMGIENRTLSLNVDYTLSYRDETRVDVGTYLYDIALTNANYTFAGDSSEITGELKINKAVVSEVILPTTTAITYGKLLSGTNSLNLSSAHYKVDTGIFIPGSFSWNEDTFLNAGNGQTVRVKFTPTDTTDKNFDYDVYSKINDVQIDVNKATLKNSDFVYPTSTPIIYSPSQYLSASALNGGSATYQTDRGAETVEGTFSWVGKSTIRPTHTNSGYEVQFTTANTNFNTPTGLTTLVALTVNKADYNNITHGNLSITYSYGTKLSDVTGLLSNYSWENETELIYPTNPVGAKEYNATYNADPANYNTFELTIRVTVNKGSLFIDTYPVSANSITYPQKLSSAIINNASAKVLDNGTRTHQVAGTWSWKNENLVPEAGKTNALIKFTIADENENNYYNLTYSGVANPTIEQVINKAKAKVTFPTVDHTKTYSETQKLTAINIVNPGAFEYYDTDTSTWIELSAAVPNSSFTWYNGTNIVPTVQGANIGYRMDYSLYQSGNYDYSADTDHYHSGEIYDTVSFTLEKADFVGVTHTQKTITYFKGITLANSGIALNTYWRWEDETTSMVPSTSTGTSFNVIYNKDSNNYNDLHTTVNVVINKGTLNYSVSPTTSTITYTQILADSTLTGGYFTDANATEQIIRATFSWANPTTKPSAGTWSNPVSYELLDEEDIGRYVVKNGINANVTVNKVKAKVVFPIMGSSYTYETPLSSIGAVNSEDKGYLAYLDPADGVSYVKVTEINSDIFTWNQPSIKPTVINSGYRMNYTLYQSTNYNYLEDENYHGGEIYKDVAVTIIKKAPTTLVFPTATEITYGNQLLASSFTGANAGTANNGSAGGTFSWKTPTIYPQANVDPGDLDQKKFTVVFTPTSENVGNYDYSDLSKLANGNEGMTYNEGTNTVEKDITVNVKKVQITSTGFSAPTASAVTYGETLAKSELTGATFIYSIDGSATALEVTCTWVTGTYKFTQAGLSNGMSYVASIGTGDNFISATFNTGVMVNKATPVVDVYPSIANEITYGNFLRQSLIGSVVQGKAIEPVDEITEVPGTWSWKTGDVIPEREVDDGDNLIKKYYTIVFTPNDSTNFNSIEIDTSKSETYPNETGAIIVNKASPSLTIIPQTINYRQSQCFKDNTFIVKSAGGEIKSEIFNAYFTYGSVTNVVPGYCVWDDNNTLQNFIQPTREESYKTYIKFIPTDDTKFETIEDLLFEITVIQDIYTSVVAPVFQTISYSETLTIASVNLNSNKLHEGAGYVETLGVVTSSEGLAISGQFSWEQTESPNLTSKTYDIYTLKFTPEDTVNYPIRTNIQTTFTVKALTPTVVFGKLAGIVNGSSSIGNVYYGNSLYYYMDNDQIRSAVAEGQDVPGNYEWYRVDEGSVDQYVTTQDGKRVLTKAGMDALVALPRNTVANNGFNINVNGFRVIGSDDALKNVQYHELFGRDSYSYGNSTLYHNINPLTELAEPFTYVCRFVPTNTSIDIIGSNPYKILAQRIKVTFDMNDSQYKANTTDKDKRLLYQRYKDDLTVVNALDPNENDTITIYMRSGDTISEAISDDVSRNPYRTQLMDQIIGGIGVVGLHGVDNDGKSYSAWKYKSSNTNISFTSKVTSAINAEVLWGYSVSASGSVVQVYNGKTIVVGQGFYDEGNEVTLKFAKRAIYGTTMKVLTRISNNGKTLWSWENDYWDNNIYSDYVVPDGSHRSTGDTAITSISVSMTDPDYIIIKFIMPAKVINTLLYEYSDDEAHTYFPLNVSCTEGVQATESGPEPVSIEGYKASGETVTLTVGKLTQNESIEQGLNNVIINGVTVFAYNGGTFQTNNTITGINNVVITTDSADIITITFEMPTIEPGESIDIEVNYIENTTSMYTT